MGAFNADGLIHSNQYEKTMKNQALPYIEERRTDITVESADGHPLFASRFDADAPVGTVLIVHGFTENVEKFSEIIHSLLKNGLSVVAYDQRGHGRSWRSPGLKDLSLTHVDHFGEYVNDMSVICSRVLFNMPRPHRLFCHSMGGAVTALFLEEHPGQFDRVVMSSPMIEANFGMPVGATRLLCRTFKALRQSRKRVFVSKPYVYPDDFDTAPANGRARFDWYEKLRRDDPQLSNNSPTYGWTLEAVGVTDAILAPGQAENIDANVRLYSAALDQTVMPEPQKTFIDRVPNGSYSVVEGAKHEIYRSPDEVLFPWWHEVLSFLKP